MQLSLQASTLILPRFTELNSLGVDPGKLYILLSLHGVEMS